MTDWRELCRRLASYLQGRKDREIGWPGEDPEQDLLDHVHALLAQAEPEVRGPSDEELLRLAREWNSGYENIEFVEFIPDFARAVLARFGGCPAPAAEVEVAELVRQEVAE